jgi:hypothetical protein
MQISNLAQRLEDFAAVEAQAREASRQPPPMVIVAPRILPVARRRAALETRRIEIRDHGLRSFRVF